MKKFFDKFQSLKGASFISVNGYENSAGEIANLIINTNISVKNAKVKDLETLKNVTEKDIADISLSSGIGIDVLNSALSELVTKAEQNLSEKIEDRSTQSKAQADTYIHLTPAIKMHKETLQIYVTGMRERKTVIKPGEYKKVNSRPLTLAKNAIKRHCDLRMEKYRTFKIGNMNEIKINGDTLSF